VDGGQWCKDLVEVRGAKDEAMGGMVETFRACITAFYHWHGRDRVWEEHSQTSSPRIAIDGSLRLHNQRLALMERKRRT